MIFAVFFPFIAAFLVWLVSKKKAFSANIMIIISVVELIATNFMLVSDMTGGVVQNLALSGVGGLGISFKYIGFKGVFGVLTAVAWFVTFLFSKEYMKNDTNVIRYDIFNLMTLGATMGIFYAADFFTLFFFFEIMSFTSFMWVAHRQTEEAEYAAGTYLGIAIAGGLSILMGLFIVYHQFGTLTFDELQKISFANMEQDKTMLYVAAGCMFAGFGAKASAFPVHVWLSQSYTEAPAPATALLSAILSKTGVFGILLVTVELLPMNGGWGMFVLATGIITMVVGGIRAVLSNNLKTTIAYSSMSQIGFILFGVGMMDLLGELAHMWEILDGEILEEVMKAYNMAINGTFIYMINHSLAKLVLFLVAGVVFMHVGSYDLNQVRGFGRKKPFLFVCFVLAAAGLSGVPLLNGYVSKTLLHESIVEYMNVLVQVPDYAPYTVDLMKKLELLFLFSGGLTLCYMLKLFVVLFVEKNTDSKQQRQYEETKRYASVTSKIAIGLCALPIPFIGLLPNVVAKAIADYGYGITLPGTEQLKEHITYFSLENLKGAFISITVGVVLYFLVVRLVMLQKKGKQMESTYVDIFPKWIDLEKYVYRAVFFRAIPFVLGITSRILDSIVDTCVVLLRKTVYKDLKLPYELPEGNVVTHDVAVSMENIRKVYCQATGKNYEKKNYEHKIALKNEDFFENMRIIERSLSFGLFMFCVGLLLTLVYLIMVN